MKKGGGLTCRLEKRLPPNTEERKQRTSAAFSEFGEKKPNPFDWLAGVNFCWTASKKKKCNWCKVTTPIPTKNKEKRELAALMEKKKGLPWRH